MSPDGDSGERLHKGLPRASGNAQDCIQELSGRLRAILECTRPEATDGREARTRELALDGTVALTRLQAELAHDRSDRRRLERELGDARTALAHVRSEFEDSQAGELHARHLALHDELTMLPNRRHCHERLEQALAWASAGQATVAMMFLDLDGFKAINDNHGHEAGDEVLRIVAARLSRAVRAGDIVCRLGGDEFVCLPHGPMGEQQLAQLARKLIDAVSAPWSLGGCQFEVQPSIGVAVFPTHADTTEGLIKAADGAMYRAKATGSGFAFAKRGADDAWGDDGR